MIKPTGFESGGFQSSVVCKGLEILGLKIVFLPFGNVDVVRTIFYLLHPQFITRKFTLRLNWYFLFTPNHNNKSLTI
jgi:hypothetical protein